MTFYQRSFIALRRNKRKYLLLFAVFLMLGILSAVALFIQSTVERTQENLMDQFPAVAAIVRDQFAVEETIRERRTLNTTSLQSEAIHKIGALPYVRDYTLSLQGTGYNTTLDRYLNRFPRPHWGEEFFEAGDSHSLRVDRSRAGFVTEGLERFPLRGIFSPEVLEVEHGFIHLTHGRYFTEEEILEGTPVAWISEGMAKINHLTIGSRISLKSILFDSAIWGLAAADGDYILENYSQSIMNIEVEIIGIFELASYLTLPSTFTEISFTQQQLNQIYLPYLVVQRMNQFLEEEFTNITEESYGEFSFSTLFLLEDPRDLATFTQAANEILDRYWRIEDLTGNLDIVLNYLNFLDWFAETLLIFTFGSSLLVLGLTTFLLLRERKNELLLYWALGEKKVKIMTQLFLEMFLVGNVALIAALSLTNGFSGPFLETLINSGFLEDESQEILFIEVLPPELAWFNTGVLTTDEIIEYYHPSLGFREVLLFFVAGGGMILVATTTGVAYLWKVKYGSY